jgi:ABC-type spermidine/putrescine transport system permease subunit II
MQRAATSATVLLASPVLIVALASIAHSSAEFTSPCVGWNSGNFHKTAGANDTCRQYTVDSRTRTQAALSMAFVPGVILLTAVLGIWGTFRLRQTVVIVAGLLMFLEMIPLALTVWPLALLAGTGFLVAAFGCRAKEVEFTPHLHISSLFAIMEKFREYSFLLLRYHCECSQSGRE